MIERMIVGSLYTNTYVVATGKKECMVIDPGADPEQLIHRLEVLNMIPTSIVFTHGHLDNTAAAKAVVDHYADRSPDMQVGIHRSDRSYLPPKGEETNRELFEALGPNAVKAFQEMYAELQKPNFFLKDGDQILDTDLVTLHTPGHSQGSCCLYSEERGVLFSGDTLFFEAIGRTDIIGADRDKLVKSIEKTLFELPPETRLFPGHGQISTLEREIANNGFEPYGQI